MVGVTSHMPHGNGTFRRFYVGFTLGGLAASLFVSVPIMLLAKLGSGVAEGGRVAICAAGGMVFAVQDFRHRTPFLRRQVPQDLSLETQNPGFVGLYYGADMGLLFTTQKTTSLVWFGLLCLALFNGTVPILGSLILYSATATTALLMLAWRRSDSLCDLYFGGRSIRQWTSRAQYLSASAAFAVVLVAVHRMAS